MDSARARGSTTFFSFGDWTVRPDQRCLERGAERIMLEPKLMDVLTYLAGTGGNIVSVEQLLVDCWHGTFYGDNPVHKTIALLRKALKDDSKVPRYIETVRKRGYRVIADVAFADERIRGSPKPHSWTGGSPYRGLLSFDAEHAPLFFGRSRATSELLALLRFQLGTCAFVLVTGPSGCGKSSLVHAGVLPALMREAGYDGLRAVASTSFSVVTPGLTTLEALAYAITRWTVHGRPIFLETERQALARAVCDDMQSVADRVTSALGNSTDGAKTDVLLLVVETLEALVTMPCVARHECADFFNALSILARSHRVMILALCRNDFYPSLMEIPELVALKRMGGLYDVTVPTSGEIAQMIRMPAIAAGLQFERDPETEHQLDDVLLEAACHRRGALPLLQYTLQALYELRDRNHVLTFATYRELGSLEGALAQRAETAFATLSSDAPAALASVLERLVTVSSDGVDVTACTVPWRHLADPAQRLVVQHLVDEHLLVSMLDDNEPCFTVAHESLLHHWPRVVHWVESHRMLLRSYARISEMAGRWLTEGRRQEHLLPRGMLLADARVLYTRATPPMTEQQRLFVRRSLQRAWLGKTLLVTTCVIIATLIVLSSLATLATRRAEARANRQRTDVVNLLDFMLGDLHERLDAVGRLDLLDAVTARALSVLSRDSVTDNPDDVLLQARALREIGEIRFKRADLASAQSAFRAATHRLQMLLAHFPRLPAVYAELGKLDFWRGQIAYSRNRLDEAHTAWLAYLTRATQRMALDPAAPDAWLELSYANNCLGTFALRNGQLHAAVERFEQSILLKHRFLAIRKNDSKAALELADSMSWLALAQKQLGELQDSLASYQAERSAVASIEGQGTPSNLWKYRNALANLHVAKAEADLGFTAAAVRDDASAAIMFTALVNESPDNLVWLRDLAYAHLQQGWLAYGLNKPDQAMQLLLDAEHELRTLLAVDPAMADWRALLVLDRSYQCLVLLRQGKRDHAAAVVLDALRSFPAHGKATISHRIIRAMLQITAGEVAAAQGDGAAKARYWHDAADALAPLASDSHDPGVLDPYVHALLLLGRRNDASVYLRRLNQAGYRLPMFESYLKTRNQRKTIHGFNAN